ncbi:hypothetical protein CP981_01285 [Streptomyces platensis]|uniref:Uncharacterized protein n=1 Tax=Streptomyces platensis TaxID=58346 RepID=A0AAE6TKQ2_STRPT|nr:hypothetical protein CP981_01285 [Streptomyces platensis]
MAEQIRHLRRPTLLAWASNLLVREAREEVQCLGLGSQRPPGLRREFLRRPVPLPASRADHSHQRPRGSANPCVARKSGACRRAASVAQGQRRRATPTARIQRLLKCGMHPVRTRPNRAPSPLEVDRRTSAGRRPAK